MLKKMLLLMGGMVILVPAMALANSADPGMFVDSTDPSCGTENTLDVTGDGATPFALQLAAVKPNGTNCVEYQLVNNSGQAVDSLTFDWQLNSGNLFVPEGSNSTNPNSDSPFILDYSDGHSATYDFTCATDLFGLCTITYNRDTGDLKYVFSDDVAAGDPLFIGLQGWTDCDSITSNCDLYVGRPVVTASYTNPTPEPSALPFLAGAMLLGGAVVGYRRRRQYRKA